MNSRRVHSGPASESPNSDAFGRFIRDINLPRSRGMRTMHALLYLDLECSQVESRGAAVRRTNTKYTRALKSTHDTRTQARALFSSCRAPDTMLLIKITFNRDNHSGDSEDLYIKANRIRKFKDYEEMNAASSENEFPL